MRAAISLEGAARWYGQVLGLHATTLQIGDGITGLVGPNGAGKSTLIKLVTGQLRPSTGRVTVFGENPFANPRVLRRLGYCPSDDAFYEDLSGRAFVTMCLRLHGFSRSEAADRASSALHRVELDDAADRAIRGYSKGMRQRVKLAQAVAHDPALVIADEPLNGLDPLARRFMSVLFRKLAESGVRVLVSSHVLHELESLTENVVLVHRGEIIGQGPVGEIRRLLVKQPRKVRMRADEPRPLAIRLLEHESVISARIDGDGMLVVETTALDQLFSDLPAIVASTDAGVRFLESPDASLEAVFDYMMEPS